MQRPQDDVMHPQQNQQQDLLGRKTTWSDANEYIEARSETDL